MKKNKIEANCYDLKYENALKLITPYSARKQLYYMLEGLGFKWDGLKKRWTNDQCPISVINAENYMMSGEDNGEIIHQKNLCVIQDNEKWFTKTLADIPSHFQKESFVNESYLDAIHACFYLFGFGRKIEKTDSFKMFEKTLKKVFKKHYMGHDKKEILKSSNFPRLAYLALLPSLKELYLIHFHSK